jgi:hypothetical protein
MEVTIVLSSVPEEVVLGTAALPWSSRRTVKL